MHADITDLSARLSLRAEAFCRHYLPQGRRKGAYWVIGDVTGAPGRSLYVRLAGPNAGPGAQGRWRDAATGQHGDLLDLLALHRGHSSMAATLEEARRFLSEPAAQSPIRAEAYRNVEDRVAAAQRLFAASCLLAGTLAEAYFATRGIVLQHPEPWLRFHPRCKLRVTPHSSATEAPAIIAGVTDLTGRITGVQRLFLATDGSAKAAFDDPKRALGVLHGHGVWLGPRNPTALIVGEGLETMLSLRMILPEASCVATLAAAHLAAFLWPPDVSRLILAADHDRAGLKAADHLLQRARHDGITASLWCPATEDWNTELQAFGADALRPRLAQLWREHSAR
jgi:hypothetical protein